MDHRLKYNLKIISKKKGVSNQKYKPFNKNIYNKKTLPSIHILIATIGKQSIMRMLESIKGQLNSIDFVTIVYDNKDIDNTFGQVTEFVKQFHCKVNIIMEETNLGYWGHGIRNKYCNIIKDGDFLIHADDDDKYRPNSIALIKLYSVDRNSLYIFRTYSITHKSVLWRAPIIERTNIGTPNGIFPINIINRGIWRPHYGGDFYYCRDISMHVPNIIFVPIVIYDVS
jgi:hypothetical protein